MTENRIMVVDGSAVSRELVARILRQQIEGAQVTTCASGDEALDHLAGQQYHLITTALMLGDMDGLDLCRHIRGSEHHSYTPIIVISSDADERLLKEGFAAGVTDYFDKALGYPAFGEFVRDFTSRNNARGLVGRVLFVEDSRTAATVTTRILEHHGLAVSHTTNAEQALEWLHQVREAKHADFDLVITDFHLTGELTGGDLLHALRSRLHYSQQELPVLIITGNDDMQTQVEAFHAGANDFVSKPLVEEVLMARVRSLLFIKQQYDALKRQAHDMELLATTDTLTGLRNRRYLYDNGKAWLKDAKRQPLGVMLLDIDFFKTINDTHGHQVGDRVLEAVGGELRSRFADGMTVRYGGEEFAILLPRTDVACLEQYADSLRSALEGLRPGGIPISVSTGICNTAHHPDADLDTLLNLADQALYRAKEEGRNRVCCHKPNGVIITASFGA